MQALHHYQLKPVDMIIRTLLLIAAGSNLFIRLPPNLMMVNAQPSYSQQCQDDAGPPFNDDGTWVYHKGSYASPLLKENGECADKMKQACSDRDGDSKTAYMEGPPDCGGKGWYCRILEEEEENGWDPLGLTADVNFGYCNTTEGFEDVGYDRSGHCHGSDDDSTYYWWMRDHWYRQYNGRLRCCCDWNQLTEGKVTNRCDFRRLVVDENDANSCRDANEDHGLSFEGGCTGPAQLNEPLEEDDSMCWELHKFGHIDEYGDGGGNEFGDDLFGCKQSGGLRGVLKSVLLSP